jgi:hypothetical protein
VDGLSDPARRLIAAAMAQDAPPAGAEDDSWGMVLSRVDEPFGGDAPVDGDAPLDSDAPLGSDAPSQRTIVAPSEPAKAAHMPAPGERIGRFLVIDVLGQGAMGVVVRAFDPRLERTLAIKVVSPKRGGDKAERARARLVAEAPASPTPTSWRCTRSTSTTASTTWRWSSSMASICNDGCGSSPAGGGKSSRLSSRPPTACTRCTSRGSCTAT